MTKTMEIYFNDLTPDAQKRYLELEGVSDASDLNWEVNPVAIVECESEEEEV